MRLHLFIHLFIYICIFTELSGLMDVLVKTEEFCVSGNMVEDFFRHTSLIQHGSAFFTPRCEQD